MSIKDITVIITTFKSGEKIRNCLNSINRETKVLLIENSNHSETKKNIEEEFRNVECILTGANLGYGKSNNIGLKKVTTKYALILIAVKGVCWSPYLAMDEQNIILLTLFEIAEVKTETEAK